MSDFSKELNKDNAMPKHFFYINQILLLEIEIAMYSMIIWIYAALIMKFKLIIFPYNIRVMNDLVT